MSELVENEEYLKTPSVVDPSQTVGDLYDSHPLLQYLIDNQGTFRSFQAEHIQQLQQETLLR